MKIKYILGIAIIIILSLYAGLSFKRSLTPYVSFQEARRSDNTVQTIGGILHRDVYYDLEKGKLYFVIEDENKDKLKVEYDGTRPANFDQATTAVVVGQYKQGLFVAEKVLVKCPSKYEERY